MSAILITLFYCKEQAKKNEFNPTLYPFVTIESGGLQRMAENKEGQASSMSPVS